MHHQITTKMEGIWPFKNFSNSEISTFAYSQMIFNLKSIFLSLSNMFTVLDLINGDLILSFNKSFQICFWDDESLITVISPLLTEEFMVSLLPLLVSCRLSALTLWTYEWNSVFSSRTSCVSSSKAFNSTLAGHFK